MLKNKRSLLIILGTVVLAVVAIFTAWRLSQPGPVAPTAPKQAPAQEQEPPWGSYFSLPTFSLIPGEAATPTPTPTTGATAAPTPTPTGAPVATPTPTATPTATPTVAPTTTPTPTPAPGTGGTGTTSPLSPASAPTCGDTKPGTPTITSATAGTNTVTLRWTKASDPVTHYFVVYGTSPGKDQFGSPDIGNKDTTSYQVKSLSGGTTYYFRIAAVNNCMPGNYSNEISAKPSGGALTGGAEGFKAVTGTTALAPTKTTATPTATPSALPVSGINTPTIAVGIGGILLLLLGLALVF